MLLSAHCEGRKPGRIAFRTVAVYSEGIDSRRKNLNPA